MIRPGERAQRGKKDARPPVLSPVGFRIGPILLRNGENVQGSSNSRRSASRAGATRASGHQLAVT